ncbi:MAG TPA: hypothetical protein VGG41_19650 [Solirubrobacteraceae bacterium]
MLRWTRALADIPISAGLLLVSVQAALFGLAVTGFAVTLRARWHHYDVLDGADPAEHARHLPDIRHTLAEHSQRCHTWFGVWINGEGMAVGVDRSRSLVGPFRRADRMPPPVVEATGSGKTVTQAWIVEHGHGAIIIDPKGETRTNANRSAPAAQRRPLGR